MPDMPISLRVTSGPHSFCQSVSVALRIIALNKHGA